MPADESLSSEETPDPRVASAVGTVHVGASVLAHSLSLEAEAEKTGLSVADQIALKDAALREWTATQIIQTFVRVNLSILLALAVLVALDEINLWFGFAHPGERIIDHQVIMTLLGATTVQVGSIAAIIARYLFPGRSR